MPCLALPCLVLSCLVLSCLALPCLVLSCLVLSCLVLPCLALSCVVLSCLAFSEFSLFWLNPGLRYLALPHPGLPRLTSDRNRPFPVQGLPAFRQRIFTLASDRKWFRPCKLPPAWVETDRLVKRRRTEGRSIMRVDELVTGLTKGDGRDFKKGAAGGSGLGGQSREDYRAAVVSTVRGR